MDCLILYGVKGNLTIEKEKTEYKSMKELFMPKRAYSMAVGKTYKVVEGSLELDFSGVIRA